MPSKALIPLPAETSPTGTHCVQFNIPNDSQWIAMFYGALYQLGVWSSYDRDEAHTGAVIAEAWRTIIADSREACVVPQFRQQDNCLLQVSLDEGATWDTIYDGSLCVKSLVPVGNEPVSGVNGAVGVCTSYELVVDSSNVVTLPVRVRSTDTIEIIAHSDNLWTDDWIGWMASINQGYCIDGTVADALTGICGEIEDAHEGDLVMGANHMELLMNINGVFYRPLNGIVTVPNGMTNAEVKFLVNDSDFANNFGQNSITVEVCTTESEFTHIWDFTVDDGDWTPVVTGGFTRARYVAGTGWKPGYDTDDYSDRISISKNTPGDVDVTFTKVKVFMADCTGVTGIGILGPWGAPYPACNVAGAEWSGSASGHQVTLDETNDRPYQPFIVRVEISGHGPDPWA